MVHKKNVDNSRMFEFCMCNAAHGIIDSGIPGSAMNAITAALSTPLIVAKGLYNLDWQQIGLSRCDLRFAMNLSLSRKEDIIKLEQLESLYAVVETISSKLRVEDILEAVPSAVKAVTRSEEILIALTSKTDNSFAVETLKNTCPHPSHLIPKFKRRSCAESVIRTNKPVLILSSNQMIFYDKLDDLLVSNIVFAVVPLSARNKNIGFLSVLAPKTRSFSRIDIVLLTVLANHIATAIENARLHMRIQELTLAKERSRIAKEILSVVMKADICDELLRQITAPDNLEELTSKEKKILALMARGYTNEEIANELWIGLKTVKTHVSNILRKLGQRNRVQAVMCALKRGLVEIGSE